MGYTGHVVYKVDGDTNTLYEWKHDNTEDAMRFAEAIRLVRGADVKPEYLDLSEGHIYSSICYSTFNNKDIKSLHLMSGVLGDALSKKHDFMIDYDKEENNYNVKYFVRKDRALGYCSLDEKRFKEFTDALAKSTGKSADDYKKLAHEGGIKIPSEDFIKALKPVVLERIEEASKTHPKIAEVKSGLVLVDSLRDEISKGNEVYLCARASANGRKNIVMRVNNNGKKSIKTLPYKAQDMTLYSLCVSGEWAGNYEKIDKKEDANLLLQANRLIGKSKSMYSSIARKVAKDLQDGKEASLDIGGSY